MALEDAVAHHLTRVLRLRDGAAIELFDGDGRCADGALRLVDGSARATQRGPAREAIALPAVHVILALTKGPAMDLAVRMATEAGATALYPALTARSVARGDRADRWARIAASAATQCRRPDVPAVHDAQPLADALAAVAQVALRYVADPDGEPLLAPGAGEVAVVIGPEGGLTAEELAACDAAGFVRVRLARHVLRADTAAAVVTAWAAGR